MTQATGVREGAGTQEPVPRPSLTYLVVDGENLDATLGSSILRRRPAPEDRPRWDRVHEFAARLWRQPVKGLFFINCSTGDPPMPFIQMLLALDYQPILLRGRPDQKVVDIGIARTLDALVDRTGDVLLASHDGDFLASIGNLLGGNRRVAVLGFREFVNAGFRGLTADGLEILDLEDDADAFTHALPRVRVIDVDAFDPTRYL